MLSLIFLAQERVEGSGSGDLIEGAICVTSGCKALWYQDGVRKGPHTEYKNMKSRDRRS